MEQVRVNGAEIEAAITNRIEQPRWPFIHARLLSDAFIQTPVYVFSAFNRLESHKIRFVDNCFRSIVASPLSKNPNKYIRTDETEWN